MNFDYHDSTPLFLQVARELENAIFSGLYEAGEQVPSTTEISQTYQLNPATVLKGMNILVDRQVLEKRRGVGMFVTPSAMRIISQHRSEQFRTQQLHTFIQRAKQLGITKEELIQLVERGFEHDASTD